MATHAMLFETWYQSALSFRPKSVLCIHLVRTNSCQNHSAPLVLPGVLPGVRHHSPSMYYFNVSRLLQSHLADYSQKLFRTGCTSSTTSVLHGSTFCQHELAVTTSHLHTRGILLMHTCCIVQASVLTSGTVSKPC